MQPTGKKLFILGATAPMVDVVQRAKALGIYTIVTDWTKDAVAKPYADRVYDVSTADTGRLLEIIHNENVDGIFAAFDDFNTNIACELCAKTGLPFYATPAQLAVTKNKLAFKELCTRYGVPVVPQYNPEEPDIPYPVVVKPADSYGARGILRCNTPLELKAGCAQALTFSQSGQVVVEKFMDVTKPTVNIEYVLRDGDIRLSAVGDLYVNNAQGNLAALSSAVVYPSIRTAEYKNTLDAKVRGMFAAEGFCNGMIYIQAFYQQGRFYFFEMGYRLGGGQSYHMLKKTGGFDYRDMLISFALGGEMCTKKEFDAISPEMPCYACGLVVLLKPGTILQIEGLDAVKNLPEFVHITQFVGEGECIADESKGTLNQTFARIHLVAKTKGALRQALNTIAATLKITGRNGEDMIVNLFSGGDVL